MMTRNNVRALTLVFAAAAFVGCGESTTTDVQGTDSTSGTDTNTGTDVQGTDTVQATDTGSTGTPLNGCATFMDLTAAGANRAIGFAGTAYTPNCITIAVGQSVTFSGDFTMHPLAPGRAPSRPATDGASSESTPITATPTGTSAMFTFAAAGDYGFYCQIHESLGMYGVIRVQ